MEYGLEAVTGTGIPFDFAYSIRSALPPKDQVLQGAIISFSGANDLNANSKRTWSFPFTVAPGANGYAPYFFATYALAFAINGLAKEVPSKYLIS